MKKLLLVLLAMISIFLLSACGNSNSKQNDNDVSLNGFNVITTQEESTTKNTNLTHNDIEKVIITYLDNEEVITEEQQSFEFIENIKNCNTVPDTSLTMKIGNIRIKYYDKKEEADFATLYLGMDGSVYAKYVKSENEDFAYKVN